MKTLFFKMILISGIVFTSGLIEKVTAVENPLIPQSVTEVQCFQFNQEDTPAKNNLTAKKMEKLR